MTREEFLVLAAHFGQLEDYLREQRVNAVAVGHNVDARVMERALQMTIAAQAQAQILLEDANGG